MFEDEVDEVGSAPIVQACLPKMQKADTTHVVISSTKTRFVASSATPCGDVHSFRKPGGEAEDHIPEPAQRRQRALMKEIHWEEFFASMAEGRQSPTNSASAIARTKIVFHPKFGKGLSPRLVSESKVEITFADARRILVHNRKDIPGSPLAAEDDGLPTGSVANKPAAGTKAKEKKAGGAGQVCAAQQRDGQQRRTKADVAPKPVSKKTSPEGRCEKAICEEAGRPRSPAAKKPAAKSRPPRSPAAKKPAAKKPAAKEAGCQEGLTEDPPRPACRGSGVYLMTSTTDVVRRRECTSATAKALAARKRRLKEDAGPGPEDESGRARGGSP